MRPIVRFTLLALALPLTTAACTLRYTVNQFDDGVLTNQTKGISWQGGVAFLGRNSPLGRTDFQLLVAHQAFWSTPRTVLTNFELTMRHFPIRRGPLRPYGGIGVGRHSFGIEEDYSTCPPGYICFPGYDNDFVETNRENLRSGFNAHGLFGVELGFPRARGALVFEATRVVGARHSDFDFNGWRYAIGTVIRTW